MNQDNLYAVSRLYLWSMDVRISPATLKKEIFLHPLYPSLLSLTDALDKWEIPFEAIRLNKEETQLEDIEVPFIAHLNSGNGRFILVREVRGGKVLYSDETSLHGEFSEYIFRQQWEGIVFHIEPGQTCPAVEHVNGKERRDVQVNLLFATNGDERDPGVMVAQHLLQILDENQEKLNEALSAWYGMESKSFDSLSRQYPVAGKRSFIEELRVQKLWSESNGVRGTPTWFINGKLLPDIYNWTEIKLLLN